MLHLCPSFTHNRADEKSSLDSHRASLSGYSWGERCLGSVGCLRWVSGMKVAISALAPGELGRDDIETSRCVLPQPRRFGRRHGPSGRTLHDDRKGRQMMLSAARAFTGGDLTKRAASSALIHALGRLVVLRQLLAAYWGADTRRCLLRIAATSARALTTLLGFRSRVLARVSVFDRHIAEAGLPAGSPAIASHPALRENRQGSEKAGDIPSQ